MEYFLVRYDSRVVIYKRKMFIRLATGQRNASFVESNISFGFYPTPIDQFA